LSKLSPLEKWSYALGGIPQAAKDAAFVNFVVFYYTQVLGLSGTLTGLAMLIALTWDAISDPLVGSWSDTVRTRWGRRHPPILVGGIATAFMFLLLFNPPAGLDETQIFLWLLGVSLLLRTFITINFIPYQAMGAELSTDYDQRTIIAKARVTIAWLAGMALPAIAFLFFFQADGDRDGRLVAENYWYYGLMTAALMLLAVLASVWGTRSAIPRLPQAAADSPRFSLSRPLTDFLLAAKNYNFRISIGTKLAFGICAGSFTTLGLYMGTYFWEFTSTQLAGLVIPTFFGTITAFTTIHRLGKRYDKPQLIAGLCLLFFFNTLWFIGGRLLGVLPDNGHGLLYLLQLVQVYLSVFILVSMQILGASLLADILDQQEVETGIRQEGVFFAASTFVYKATTGVGTFIGGITIDLVGLKPGIEPGAVPESTLTALGWISGPVVSLLVLVAWYFATKIRLSRQQVHTIQAQLAARVSPTPP
jgi:GPH family glycoside/pentoside/hexuronide:cation symporter